MKLHPTERILVAVPDFRGNAAILSYQGLAISCDIDAVGCGIDDIGIAPPEESGLWIWEGIPYYVRSSNWECDDGGEMDYSHGEWRRPTPKELEQIQKCESIWPFTFLCMECLHEQQDEKPCEKCDSSKMISTKIVEENFGKDWREQIESFKS